MNNSIVTTMQPSTGEGWSGELVALITVIGSLITIVGGVALKLKLNRSKCGAGSCIYCDIVMHKDEMEVMETVRMAKRQLKKNVKREQTQKIQGIKESIQQVMSPSPSSSVDSPIRSTFSSRFATTTSLAETMEASDPAELSMAEDMESIKFHKPVSPHSTATHFVFDIDDTGEKHVTRV